MKHYCIKARMRVTKTLVSLVYLKRFQDRELTRLISSRDLFGDPNGPCGEMNSTVAVGLSGKLMNSINSEHVQEIGFSVQTGEHAI
jgi:hypothetical protein